MTLAVDVNIYASSSKGAWPLVGNHENTEVGNFLAKYLDVDIDDATKRLQNAISWSASPKTLFSHSQGDYAWMGDPLGQSVRTDGLDTYHGDFRKRSPEDCGCGGLH